MKGIIGKGNWPLIVIYFLLLTFALLNSPKGIKCVIVSLGLEWRCNLSVS